LVQEAQRGARSDHARVAQFLPFGRHGHRYSAAFAEGVDTDDLPSRFVGVRQRWKRGKGRDKNRKDESHDKSTSDYSICKGSIEAAAARERRYVRRGGIYITGLSRDHDSELRQLMAVKKSRIIDDVRLTSVRAETSICA
jgi:hypothetical protein